MKRGHKNSLADLTAEELRQILSYDPATGNFFWKVTLSKRAVAGKKAGYTVWSTGGWRIKIGIRGKEYMAHRLAWLYVTGRWPEYEIDHEDLDGTNNRWRNLREATSSQNMANRRTQPNNKTGYKGVCFDNGKGKFLATISIDSKQHWLGHFDTAKEAYDAYCRAAKELHGEFANSL